MKIHFSHNHGVRKHHGRIWAPGQDPFTDWVYIIAMFALLSCLLIAIGAMTYMGMDARVSQASRLVPSASSHSIDTALLKKTLSGYDDRAARADQAMRGIGIGSDPSF